MPTVKGKVGSKEERVEDMCKKWLVDGDIKPILKTESMGVEIDTALKSYPSKDGGDGGNIVDIRFMISHGRDIPVMIEVKGKKGDLVKLNSDNYVELKDNKGKISKFVKSKAVNGAVHYAEAVLKNSSYSEVLAVGVNGYEDNGNMYTEVEVYYMSRNNLNIPIYFGSFTDMSVFAKDNWSTIIDKIDSLTVSESEKERKIQEFERDFESHLKELNQDMRDKYSISVGYRVQLLCGMIMAGMGTDYIAPLRVEDLKSPETNSDELNPIDYIMFIKKITSYLNSKGIPREKVDIVVNHLSIAFINEDFWKPIKEDGYCYGESKLKLVYKDVVKYILPMFGKNIAPELKLDLTGKLFNVINEWVDVPDNEKNDVVLTPRNVTDMMARLCCVNCDSYVWDYATGTAGFLVSSMKYMLQDAEQKHKGSKRGLEEKKLSIRSEQLLGIELRPDMYVLAVLNMILMGDGSTNLLNKNSMTDYEGTYEQGSHKNEPFPATAFLLNPPYSAPGKGLNFVERALSRMKSGRAAVLIQENAGSGNGGDYARNLLKKNSLIASIKMADIFCGKAGVQTAIYVFEVGVPHDEQKYVKFVDFSNDGYSRSNRKKSSSDVNFKNTDHAIERHQEVLDYILGRKKQEDLEYYSKEECFEDKIGLEGKDWTVAQHKKIDTKATREDFEKVVGEYLSWKVGCVLRGEV